VVAEERMRPGQILESSWVDQLLGQLVKEEVCFIGFTVLEE